MNKLKYQFIQWIYKTYHIFFSVELIVKLMSSLFIIIPANAFVLYMFLLSGDKVFLEFFLLNSLIFLGFCSVKILVKSIDDYSVFFNVKCDFSDQLEELRQYLSTNKIKNTIVYKEPQDSFFTLVEVFIEDQSFLIKYSYNEKTLTNKIKFLLDNC